MAKTMKRAWIIFFALAISCLLVVGCALSINIANNYDILELESDQIKITADFQLEGSEQEMTDIWKAAIQTSINRRGAVKVVLENDWTAQADPDFTTSFGNGVGFSLGRIHIPVSAYIVLDLNGYTIDRGLNSEIEYGQVFYVLGTLVLEDQKYDSDKVHQAYEADHSQDLEPYGAGKITGGYVSVINGADFSHMGGAINVFNGTFVMNSGVIYNNKAKHKNNGNLACAGISGYGNSVVTINDGLITNNSATNSDSSAIVVGGTSTLNIRGGLIHKNFSGGDGAVFVTNQANFNLEGGIISQNTAYSHGTIIFYSTATFNFSGGIIAENTTSHVSAIYMNQTTGILNMTGGIIENNKANSNYGAIVVLNGTLNMTGGIIRNNIGATHGAIDISAGSKATFANCEIYGNYITGKSSNWCGGVFFTGSTLNIKAGVQIYDNHKESATGPESNLLLWHENKKMTIAEDLSKGPTNIGVSIYDAANRTFTQNYVGSGNSAADASKYFFSDDGLKVSASGNELVMSGTMSRKIARPSASTSVVHEVGFYIDGMTATNANTSFIPGGYDVNTMTITGHVTNQGPSSTVYTATVTPKEGFVWEDTNSRESMFFKYKIVKHKFAIPPATATSNYTGGLLRCQPYDYGRVDSATGKLYYENFMTVSNNTRTALGTQTVTFALKNLSYVEWEDGTTTNKATVWTVANKTTTINKPIQGDNYRLAYTGSDLTFTPYGLNTSQMDISGNTARDIGTYTVTVTPKSGYIWTDGTASALKFTWYIEARKDLKLLPGVTTFVYDGNPHTYHPANYDSSCMTITGNVQTNVGEYEATISLKNAGTHTWENGSTAPIKIKYKITNKMVINKPSGTGIAVYTGERIKFIPSADTGFDSNTMAVENNFAVEAGMYTVRIVPKYGYMWQDGTTTPVEMKFEVLYSGVFVSDESGYDYVFKNGKNERETYAEAGIIHKSQNEDTIGEIDRFVLGGISPNTTVAGFLANVTNDISRIQIFDLAGDKIYDGLNDDTPSDKIYVATGFKVVLYKEKVEKEIWDEVYLSILGDLTGDGIVSAMDVSALTKVLQEGSLSNLPLEEQLAVYLDNKGEVGDIDIELLKNMATGKISNKEVFENTTSSEVIGYKYLSLDNSNGVIMRRNSTTPNANGKKVLGNIAQKTTIVEFIANVKSMADMASAKINLYMPSGNGRILMYSDANPEAVGDIDQTNKFKNPVATGWYFTINGAETEQDRIYLSVLGDVTGDGFVNAMDVTYLNRLAANKNEIKDLIAANEIEVVLAALLTNKGQVTTADSKLLWQAVCGNVDLKNYA